MKRGTEYSYLEGALWNQIILKLNNSINIPFSNGICLEIDILESIGASRIVFNDGSNHQHVWNDADQYADIGHWKFILKDGNLIRQLNDNVPQIINNFDTTISTFTVIIQCYLDFESLKFKNFVISEIQ